MSNKIKMVCLGLTCMLLFVVSGCVETSMMYHGNLPSSAMNVVALQEGGPYAGTWETFDLLIDYKYIQGGDILEISGQAVLSEHYQMNYNALTRLYVYFFFLDEDSRVLKTANLVRSGAGTVDERLTFSQQYNIPAGTAGISFGYDGSAREMRTTTSFYELPLKK